MDGGYAATISAAAATTDFPRSAVEPVAAHAGAAAPIVQPQPRVKRKAKRGTFDRTAYQREYMRAWRAGRVGKKASGGPMSS